MGGSGGRPRQGNVGCMLPVQAAVSQSHILVETVLAPCLLTRSAQPVHGPHAQALPCLRRDAEVGGIRDCLVFKDNAEFHPLM